MIDCFNCQYFRNDWCQVTGKCPDADKIRFEDLDKKIQEAFWEDLGAWDLDGSYIVSGGMKIMLKSAEAYEAIIAAKERINDRKCCNCFWFNGDDQDEIEFCDEKEICVAADGYCARWMPWYKPTCYEDTGLTPEESMDGKLVTGWISVGERLPEPGTQSLLVCLKNGRWIFKNRCQAGGFGGQCARITAT